MAELKKLLTLDELNKLSSEPNIFNGKKQPDNKPHQKKRNYNYEQCKDVQQ